MVSSEEGPWGEGTFLFSVQFSLVAQLCLTLWTAARQASLSITNSWSLFKLMSIESVMPSNHFILCHPLLLLSSVFPSIRVFLKQHQVLLILGREILLPLMGKKKSHSFSCVDIDFLFWLAARKLKVSVDWPLVTTQDFMECIVLSGSVLLYFLSKQTFLTDP